MPTYREWEEKLYAIYIAEDYAPIMDWFSFINYAKRTGRFDNKIGFSFEETKVED